MSITRRQAIAVLAGAVPALRGIYTLAREAPPQSLRFRRARRAWKIVERKEI